MANVLNIDKQITIIGALAEGSSIRSIERITGVHRDTIMRLGVRVGEGCARLMDERMRDLPCARLEVDEIWGFVGKKQRNVRTNEEQVGSVWTWCAIDADTKLVPAYTVADRSPKAAKEFMHNLAGRMANRVQLSTDGLAAYVHAADESFGNNVDYGRIVKVFGSYAFGERRYSTSGVIACQKLVAKGAPDYDLISTSYVERLNATTRLHMRRLTRLTLAFSKKYENFCAAVGLHFAYYNFVKRHNTLRCTPAMASSRWHTMERGRLGRGRKMKQLDPNFDWVTARADCSPEKAFIVLRDQVKIDVEKRNGLLSAVELQYGIKFTFVAGSGAFRVSRTLMEEARESVVISQTEDGIKAAYSNSMGRTAFEGSLTLANDQECKLRLSNNEEISFWQFRKMALEPVLFVSTGW